MGIFDSFNYSDLYGNNYGTVGDSINNFVQGNSGSDYSAIGDAINNYVNNNSSISSTNSAFGGINWGNALRKLGRIGIGTGTGLAAMSNESKPDYIMKTQWLGNGLANTGLIDQYNKKQKQLNKILGSGDFLSSLFAGNLGGTGELQNLPVSTSLYDYNLYNTEGLSPIGLAINEYVKQG